ncbi:hypothetical protein [Corynebacterium oculi]|uniref:Anti-sigma-D factor RsdA n=1 Tax=Corynebacterium oculi TaxID=1544416 RepID=A0A0Q1AC75_9CORY|nr:hypothetical protein [Corynebacterium oculi]KQB84225.1 hypothetical protein Cocul_01022 [Corynebacterium oculi]
MNDPREQRELEFSDAFLTELSRGIDRSEGTDPLAGMLLELRSDVDKPMPEPPRLQAQVVDMRSRRRVRPLFVGLVGAAAATLVIAGSGAVLLNAGPDSPLYGLSTKLFPRQDASPDVVELAGTLEEMNSLAERGDMDGVRLLIEQRGSWPRTWRRPPEPRTTARPREIAPLPRRGTPREGTRRPP